MIALLGSSHSRGAWGADTHDPHARLDRIIAAATGWGVRDLSVSGHGSELYANAALEACQGDRPAAFLVELQVDRSLVWAWVENDHSRRLSLASAKEIWQKQFDFDGMHDHMIYKRARAGHGQTDEAWSTVRDRAHDLGGMLHLYEQVLGYIDTRALKTIRTVRNLVALERVSRLAFVPCIYWAVDGQQLECAAPFLRDLDPDRFINGINGFGGIGTTDVIVSSMGRGTAIADDGDHLTKSANQRLVADILVPGILRFAGKNAIRL